MPRSPLVGAWRLTRLEARGVRGRIDLRGEEARATGQLLYDASGRMSVLVAQPGDRTNGRLSYGGKYESYLDPFSPANDRVIHHIEFSSEPTWVGTDEVRAITLVGDTLTWRGVPLKVNGERWSVLLVWERIAGPPRVG